MVMDARRRDSLWVWDDSGGGKAFDICWECWVENHSAQMVSRRCLGGIGGVIAREMRWRGDGSPGYRKAWKVMSLNDHTCCRVRRSCSASGRLWRRKDLGVIVSAVVLLGVVGIASCMDSWFDR